MLRSARHGVQPVLDLRLAGAGGELHIGIGKLKLDVDIEVGLDPAAQQQRQGNGKTKQGDRQHRAPVVQGCMQGGQEQATAKVVEAGVKPAAQPGRGALLHAT